MPTPRRRRQAKAEWPGLVWTIWAPSRGLEPALFILDVGADEFFVALGQINNAFDQADDTANPAGADSDDDLQDALLGITKNEFMNAQAAQQDTTNAGRN